MARKFDLHIHTSRHSPDSQLDPFVLVKRAQEIGLEGIVITEHDWLWTDEELNELRAAAPELVLLAGIEVSAQAGHILVYGIHDPFAFPKEISWADCCYEAHRQGGAAVAAHPFRWNQPFEKVLERQQPELDGLELMTFNMDANMREKAATVKLQRGLAGLGSSDAHKAETVGWCYTEFEPDIRTGADLAEAIRNRRCVAKARQA
ncbi:MAG TPA: PHP domain-containing protein [Gemmataceae bacterium]|nr:PHP domain-containing protein [Gemmataceae bacterium]